MTSSSPPTAALLRGAFQKHQAGQLREAIALYRAVLQRDARNFDALQLLGLCLYQNGEPQEALKHLDAALGLRRDVASVFNHRGIVRRALGRPAEALGDFDAALALKPGLADALYNKGNALKDLGRLNEAQTCYERALEHQPGRFEILMNLAGVLGEGGRHHDALTRYEEAIARNPLAAEAHVYRGLMLHRLMRFSEAVASHDSAIRIAPRHAEAHSGRGDSLRELGRLDEALASCDAAIALKPGLAEGHCSRANVLNRMKRFDEALASYDRAIALKPDYAEAHSNRGVMLNELKRHAEALESFDRAIALKPAYAEAHSNRGIALGRLNRIEEALASYDTAIGIDGHAEARYNKGLLLLSRGDYRAGFALYRARWQRKEPNSAPLETRLPSWEGEPSAGHVLLWAEQGVGDEIFHASMLSLIPRDGVTLTLAADRRLHPVFARSFPGIGLLDRAAQAHPINEGFDAQAPVADLGGILNLTAAKLAERRYPFLAADMHRRDALREANPVLTRKRVCGIAWKSANKQFGEEKSIALSDLAPLLTSPDISFVNLQYGDVSADIADAETLLGARVHRLAGLDVFADIDGLLAAIDACDVVLTTSNVTAHLAGAIGKPAAVLVPSGSGRIWYWHEGPSSPWYPSLRLFSQADNRDWSQAIHQAAGWIRENI
ncbi:MAG: tetratricopeptide repeat protein [Aestuariivirga sp.]|nr:tetratricopeptide repeat protein [Aestuariivirga sp.]